jgi:5-formyltetrahydrofolate cyclo-ligase
VTGASAPGPEEAARAKQAIRTRVWALLERKRAARFPGAEGRIPNFAGASAAAARLASLPAWRAARVVKSNPDAPQLPVRARALADGKLLYMAVPRLTGERPFILLDPGRLEVPPRRAASIAGSAHVGRRIAVAQLQPVDLVVCGSVAVNREGARVGDRPRLPPRPDRCRRGGHQMPPQPPAAGDPLGAPRRGQGRRHPRAGRPGTAAWNALDGVPLPWFGMAGSGPGRGAVVPQDPWDGARPGSGYRSGSQAWPLIGWGRRQQTNMSSSGAGHRLNHLLVVEAGQRL